MRKAQGYRKRRVCKGSLKLLGQTANCALPHHVDVVVDIEAFGLLFRQDA